MFIEVDLREAPATVQLVEPDDFRAFKLVARGPASDRERLECAIEGFGRMSADGHVYVDMDALQDLAGKRARDSEWLASLDAMLEFARRRGWTDDSGKIRGHVQWDV